MRTALVLAALLLPLTACSGGGADEPAEAAALSPEEQLAAMRADIAELQARPEIDAERVKVQHILISFKGAPRVPATRSKEEAEALAAKVYAQVKAGEDFTRLMSEYSDDDKVVGEYLMSASEPTNAPTLWNRHGMVPAFGETGWRLDVGEIGVSPHHESKSPFGWHIVKRLE